MNDGSSEESWSLPRQLSAECPSAPPVPGSVPEECNGGLAEPRGLPRGSQTREGIEGPAFVRMRSKEGYIPDPHGVREAGAPCIWG